MSTLKTLIAALTLLAVGSVVRADARGWDPVPPPQFLERAVELSDWIVENSDYEGYEALPSFIKLPRDVINYIFYNRTAIRYDGQIDILALYIKGIVVLSEDFDLEEHEFILVHELVHHFQYENDREFECIAEAEREAHILHTKWVLQHGRGWATDPMFLLFLECNPRY